MLSMCADQDRSEVTVTPRYLMETTCVIGELTSRSDLELRGVGSPGDNHELCFCRIEL